MHIYIMRHGQAELIAPSDSERPLSSLGRVESKQMAAYLANNNVSFDSVLVSPYLRAQQTLEVVKSLLVDENADIKISSYLTPSGNINKIVNEIHALQVMGIESLLIVSHLPFVGYLVGELVPEAGTPAFSTSSVAHIEIDENSSAVLHSLTSVAQLNRSATTFC